MGLLQCHQRQYYLLGEHCGRLMGKYFCSKLFLPFLKNVTKERNNFKKLHYCRSAVSSFVLVCIQLVFSENGSLEEEKSRHSMYIWYDSFCKVIKNFCSKNSTFSCRFSTSMTWWYKLLNITQQILHSISYLKLENLKLENISKQKDNHFSFKMSYFKVRSLQRLQCLHILTRFYV